MTCDNTLLYFTMHQSWKKTKTFQSSPKVSPCHSCPRGLHQACLGLLYHLWHQTYLAPQATLGSSRQHSSPTHTKQIFLFYIIHIYKYVYMYMCTYIWKYMCVSAVMPTVVMRSAQYTVGAISLNMNKCTRLLTSVGSSEGSWGGCCIPLGFWGGKYKFRQRLFYHFMILKTTIKWKQCYQSHHV